MNILSFFSAIRRRMLQVTLCNTIDLSSSDIKLYVVCRIWYTQRTIKGGLIDKIRPETVIFFLWVSSANRMSLYTPDPYQVNVKQSPNNIDENQRAVDTVRDTTQVFYTNPQAPTSLPSGTSFFKSQTLQPLPTYYPTPLSSNVGSTASAQGVQIPSESHDDRYRWTAVPMAAEALKMAREMPAKLANEWNKINHPSAPTQKLIALQEIARGKALDVHPFALTMALPYNTEMAVSIFCNKNIAMLVGRLWELMAIKYGQDANWAQKMATYNLQSESGLIVQLNLAWGTYIDYVSSMTARQFYICVCGYAMDQLVAYWSMDIDYGIAEAHGQINAVTNPQLFTPLKPYLRSQGNTGQPMSSQVSSISARPSQQNSAYPPSASEILAPFDTSQAAVFNSFLGTPGIDGFVGGEISGRGNQTYISSQNPTSEFVDTTGPLRYYNDAATWNGQPIKFQRDDLATTAPIASTFGGGGGVGIYQASAIPTYMTYDGGPYPFAPIGPSGFGYTAPGTAPPNGFGPPVTNLQ